MLEPEDAQELERMLAVLRWGNQFEEPSDVAVVQRYNALMQDITNPLVRDILAYGMDVRMIAVARITMPKARVRLSAGRQQLGDAVQALCFLAGANSIFYGDKLLVTGNPDVQADVQLMATLGLKGHQTVNTAAQAC